MTDTAAAPGTDIRRRLWDGLAKAATGLPDGRTACLNRYRLGRLLQCPASQAGAANEDEEFAWQPRFVGRELGLRTAKYLLAGGARVGAAAAVAHMLDEVAADDSGIGRWLVKQTPGTRSVIAGLAANWAHDFVTWSGAAPYHSGVRFDWSENWPGRKVEHGLYLRARVDLIVRNGDRTELVLHTMRPAPGELELNTLVWLMCGKPLPTEVVAICPNEGRSERLAVDDAFVDAAVDQVLVAAQLLVDAVGGQPLETVPGRHCRWCERREICPDAMN